MPFRTELEWAMDICRRQGDAVIAKPRIEELYARTAISGEEWGHICDNTGFSKTVWHQLAAEAGAALLERDLVDKFEAHMHDWDRHVFNFRFAVIRPI